MTRRGLGILVLVAALQTPVALTAFAQEGHEAAAGEAQAAFAAEEGHVAAAEKPGEQAAAGEHEGGEHGGGVIGILAHHLLDSPTYELFGYTVVLPKIPGDYSFLGEGYANGFQLTKHMIGFGVAGLLLLLLLLTSTGRTRRGEVPKGLGNFFEALVVFIRDEVVYANLGREAGRKWLSFFLTLFFLILFANLLGMVPWGTTATGDVNFTAGLAVMNLLAVFVAGIAAHGVKYIGTFIPHGVPWYVAWLLFPIEVFGLFVKHFALTIRLFANMLAGHTVIGVFFALIVIPVIALASVPGAVAISLLEIFVAFLQAYVFVMLGSIFVGMAVHPH